MVNPGQNPQDGFGDGSDTGDASPDVSPAANWYDDSDPAVSEVPWGSGNPMGQSTTQPQYHQGAASEGRFPPGPVPQSSGFMQSGRLLPFSRLQLTKALKFALIWQFKAWWVWVVVIGAQVLQLGLTKLLAGLPLPLKFSSDAPTSMQVISIFASPQTLLSYVLFAVSTVFLYCFAYAYAEGRSPSISKLCTARQFGIAFALACIMQVLQTILFKLFLAGYFLWLGNRSSPSLSVYYLPFELYFAIPKFLTVFIMALIAVLVFPPFQGHGFSASAKLALAVGAKYYVVFFIIQFGAWVVPTLLAYIVRGVGGFELGNTAGIILDSLVLPMTVLFCAHIFRQTTGQPVWSGAHSAMQQR